MPLKSVIIPDCEKMLLERRLLISAPVIVAIPLVNLVTWRVSALICLSVICTLPTASLTSFGTSVDPIPTA